MPICAHCKVPIELTEPLPDNDVESLLSASLRAHDRASSSSAAPAVDESFVLLRSNPAASFLASTQALGTAGPPILPPSTSAKSASAGSRASQSAQGSTPMDSHTAIVRASKIIDFANEETSVEHPLCHDCCEQVCHHLDQQLAEAETARATYRRELEGLLQGPDAPATDEEFNLEMSSEHEREAELRAALATVEAELRQAREESAALAREEAEVDALEEEYWHAVNAAQEEMYSHLEERDWLHRGMERVAEHLTTLKCTNVLNDLFYITYNDKVGMGTINSLRMGRRPNVPFDWNECNAAWGLAALLLQVLGRRANFTFRPYRPVPLGNVSRMVCDEPKRREALELHCEEGSSINFNRVSKQSKFDAAQVAFLQCVKALGDWALSLDPRGVQLPYEIDDDKINGASIRYHGRQFGEKGDEQAPSRAPPSSPPLSLTAPPQWTKALKYTLTHLKMLMAWVAKRQQ
eukprot:tig00020830_g14456.t1